MSRNTKLSYKAVEQFLYPNIPREIEDEILTTYANYNVEADMTTMELSSYFTELQMPKELYKLLNYQDLCIDGTNVVDFDNLVRATYHLLVFMDNQETIDEQWLLLVEFSGRGERFPRVNLRNHVLSIKDLQKISNAIGGDNGHLVDMMSCATNGKRVFITYLDFAYLLGKLGKLRY